LPDKNSLEALLGQKLDTLIRLQARIAVGHLDTQKQKILFLSSAGLQPKEIGDILGVSANSVSVVLSQARKAAKTDKRDKE
jgi:DNA-directed RNA polymerase specialized sigma24 family protein